MSSSGELSRSDAAYMRNAVLVEQTFTFADGFCIEPTSYGDVTTPLGGKMRFDLADVPEMAARAAINVALEIGTTLPETDRASLSFWGREQFTKLEIVGAINDDLRQKVRQIPAALGIISNERNLISLVINPDNLGARYQKSEAIVSEPEAIKQMHIDDAEKLRGAGLVDSMMRVAIGHCEAWRDVDKPELTVSTGVHPLLLGHNNDSADIIYNTNLKLSDGAGAEGLEDLWFCYIPGTYLLRTPFDKDNEFGGRQAKYMDLTNPQHYLLQSITARNKYTMHVELYNHLRWLAASDPHGQANYDRMKQQGLTPKYKIASTDREAEDTGLIDDISEALASFNEGWANAIEEGRILGVRAGLQASLDPKTGKLKVCRPARINLYGWKPLGDSGEGMLSNLNSPLSYELGSDFVTPRSSELGPDAQIALSRKQADVLSALLVEQACYLQGATMDQMAKGQPQPTT